MQKSISQTIKRLNKELKDILKNKEVIDILLIGSTVKDKLKPEDLDLIIIFKNKDYAKIEELSYQTKKILSNYNTHIEHLIIDQLTKTEITSSIIHEGISINHKKPLSEILGFYSCSLFSFSLEKLTNVKKVRFAQTIYGRKGEGLLKKEKGIQLGRGAFLVPVQKEELFKEVLSNFNVKFNIKKAMINN